LVKINTLLKLIPLSILIIVGFANISSENLAWQSSPALSKLGEASLLLFFAFAGGEASLNVSGEVKNPQRVVPLGILSGMGAVVLLYILIQTVSQGVLGDNLVLEKQAPLAAVANIVLGKFGSSLMILGAAFSMFAALSGSVLSYPRIIFAGANKGWMPPFLAKVHPKFATPFWAIIVYALFDFTFAISGGFKTLAVVASASMLSIYLGVVAATIKLRIHNKSNNSPLFKLPFGITIPVLAIIAILWFLSNLAITEMKSLGILLLALSLVYLIIYGREKYK
jgi:basic amino acid/polyamine antiporter, APA family